MVSSIATALRTFSLYEVWVVKPAQADSKVVFQGTFVTFSEERAIRKAVLAAGLGDDLDDYVFKCFKVVEIEDEMPKVQQVLAIVE